MRLKLSQVALRTSLVYALAGLLWILLSDQLLPAVVADPALVARFHTLKGVGFVVLTGVLLYVILGRQLVRWEHEVAAREKAQTDLRHSEIRIAELAGAVPGAIYSFRLRPNGDMELPYASPKLKELFAVDPAELATDARSILRFVHREDRRHLWVTIETSAKSLTPWTCVFRAEHPQRGLIWIEGRAAPEREADGSILWHGLLLDATDRRRAEIELARQGAELQMILDSVPAFVFFKDREHRMLRANAEVLRVTGRSREQVEGRTEVENGSPFAEEYYRDENDVLATGQPKRGIIEKLASARGDRWMRTDKFPYLDAAGKIVGVVGFALDITEQVRAVELQRQQRRMLETIRVAQAAYISGGELRGPLNGLLDAILSLTGSEFGFIDEVLSDASGRPFLKTHAVTNIAWDEATRNLFARQGPEGMVFANLKTLFGAVVTTGELVIANEPTHDSRRGGLPLGHPPLHAFMGVPLKLGSRLVGVIGLANRPGGFEATLLAEYEPLLTTCVTLIEAGREARRRCDAEAAQLRSEDRFKQLVESLDEIIWSGRPGELAPTYLSPAFEKISGRPIADILNNHAAALELIHPEDQAHMLAAVARGSEGLQESIEYRIVRPDGAVRWIWDKAFPVLDDQGKVVAVHGIATDITERKACQHAAEHSLSLLRAALESTAEGLLVVDLEGRIIDYNQQLLNIWQFPETLNPGNRTHDLTTGASNAAIKRFIDDRLEDPPAFMAKVRQLYEAPESESFDVLRFQDGRIIERYSIPQRIGGRPVGRVWSFRDVTERRVADERLRSVNENLKALIEAIPDVIIFKDASGRWQITNRTARELFRLTQVEWRNRTDVELGEAQPELQAMYIACLQSDAQAWAAGILTVGMEAVPAPDGQIREFEVIKLPMFNPDGSRKALLIFGRDLTERLRSETARRDLEAQLRQSQKMEAIGQLAGGVAHDFNNLLTIIQGNVSLLLDSPHFSGDDALLAREILQASDRAAGLTRQLLLFGRKSVMQLADLDLNEVVGNLTKMLRRTLGEDIALATDYAPGLRAFHGDAGMIEQVLMNLVVNARDAMPGGGKLKLGTGMTEFETGNLPQNPAVKAGAFVCVRVTDTGKGIPQEHLARIFEPFFTTKEIGKGSGLGLATVYGIVQQHGGWVEVESTPENGSTFSVFLPATDRCASDSGAGNQAPAQPPGGKDTILVVEDEAAVRSLVVNLLQRFGYRVLPAESGLAALRVWAEHREHIDLLFTDIIMPDGMTGRDLARRLQAERADLKVVFTSGYSAELASLDATTVESLSFLQKPFSPAQLAEAIRAGLDRP